MDEVEDLRSAATKIREHPERFPVRAAVAVADLLDKIARMGELEAGLLSRVGCEEAIAVARAYLGKSGGDELDRIDRAVERITDADVDEHLRRVLGEEEGDEH